MYYEIEICYISKTDPISQSYPAPILVRPEIAPSFMCKSLQPSYNPKSNISQFLRKPIP
jgi:hypothetical protein